MVIVDMNKEEVISNETTYTKVGWTPYHGRKVKGVPIRTILRGKTVMQDGKIVGKPGDGQLVKPIIAIHISVSPAPGRVSIGVGIASFGMARRAVHSLGSSAPNETQISWTACGLSLVTICRSHLVHRSVGARAVTLTRTILG